MRAYTKSQLIAQNWKECYVEYSPAEFTPSSYPPFIQHLPLCLYNRPEQALAVAKSFAEAWCSLHPECCGRYSWCVVSGVAGVNSVMQSFICL